MKLVRTRRFALAVSFVAVLAVACSAAVAYYLFSRPRAESEQTAPAPAFTENSKTVAPRPNQLDEARQRRQAANQQFWADKLPALVRYMDQIQNQCDRVLDVVQVYDRLELTTLIKHDIHPRFDTEHRWVVSYLRGRSMVKVEPEINHIHQMCDEAFALGKELREHDDLPDDVRAQHLAELDRLMAVAKQVQRHFDVPDWEVEYQKLLKAMGKSEPVRPMKNG